MAANGLRRRRRPARRHGADLGTPEAQARRRALVGDADPRLAGYPLGVLLARAAIAADEHEAGCHYAYLCGRVLGRTQPYTPVARGSGSELSDDALANVTARWHEAVRVLMQVGRPAKDAVDNAAVFERLPGWLLRSRPRAGDAARCEALRSGLAALASWRRGQLRAPLLEAAE